MKQRINLYNPNKPKEKFDLLSLSGSVTVFAAITILMLIAGAGMTFYADSQQREFDRLQALKTDLDAQVSAEQARFQNLRVNPEIVAEQERIKAEINSRKQLQTLLYKVQPEQSVSFSEYLYGLSESSLESSWLSAFVLDTENSLLKMTGSAVNGPSVPEMLEAIGNTEVFRDMSVTDLNVQAVDNGVSFTATAELRRYE